MQVRLWNDNVHPHKEMFRGDPVAIPAKTFIVMEEEDAILLRGQYTPYFLDAGGLQDPRSYKMLRVEKISDEPATTETPVTEIEKTEKRRGRPPQTAA